MSKLTHVLSKHFALCLIGAVLVGALGGAVVAKKDVPARHVTAL